MRTWILVVVAGVVAGGCILPTHQDTVSEFKAQAGEPCSNVATDDPGCGVMRYCTLEIKGEPKIADQCYEDCGALAVYYCGDAVIGWVFEE